MDLVIPSASTSTPGAPAGSAPSESRGNADFSKAFSAASGGNTAASKDAHAGGPKDARRTSGIANGDEPPKHSAHADDCQRAPTSPPPGAMRLTSLVENAAVLVPRGRPGSPKADADADASHADRKTAGSDRVDAFAGITPLPGGTIAAPAASTTGAAGAKTAQTGRRAVGADLPSPAKMDGSNDGKDTLTGLTRTKGSTATSRYQLQQSQPVSHGAAPAAAADPAHAETSLKAAATNGVVQVSPSPDTSAIAAATTHGDGTAVAASGNALFGGVGAPAATVAANVTTPAATYAMHAPVASTAWQQELGQQLVRLVQRGTDTIDLHLNPRELGPLQISLQLHDQTAQVHFLVAHADVHNAVQQALPQLREALAGQGIALGEALVGQQQQQSPGSFGGDTDAPASAASGAEAGTADPVGAIRVVTPVPSGSGVDLYA